MAIRIPGVPLPLSIRQKFGPGPLHLELVRRFPAHAPHWTTVYRWFRGGKVGVEAMAMIRELEG